MNKFTTLKKWLTVPEAAKRLSNSFGEDISEADVLQQALDGNLKISTNIVSSVKARRTKVVAWDDTEWLMLPTRSKDPLPPELTFGNAKCPPMLQAWWARIPEDERKEFTPALCDRRIDDKRFLMLDQPITEIRGIYDLPMIGGERLDVEHQYHLLIGGPVVGLQSEDNAYVEDENGVIWQLCDGQKLSDPPTESEIQLRKLKEHISSQKIKRSEAKRLLAEHVYQNKAEYSQERDRELDKIFPCVDEPDGYESANTLPEDSVLVVRGTALREFARLMTEGPSSKETCPVADPQPRPRGHLNLDPDLQLQAKAIAAELTDKSVIHKRPTKRQVATILAKKVNMGITTVLRRIRLQW